MPARAAVEAAEYERALSDLHRSGRCRWAPCATAVDEPPTRLLLGLAAFVPRAPRAAQQAEVAAEASPELLHEWASLVQQRLEEGWRRAAACRSGGGGGGGDDGGGGAGGPRGSPLGGYVVLRGGGEQMHKAKFVVADALYIAHVLGRTLVEPRVAHARLASPANGSGRTRGGGGARLALHHYFDLQPLCARFALLPARDFERRAELPLALTLTLTLIPNPDP